MSAESRMLRAARSPSAAVKPLLVGEANPYGGDPEFALWPVPKGCAGERLCRKVMGLDEEVYLARFDRVNLCPRKWSREVAEAKAQEIQWERAGHVIVLLGAKVTRAFGLAFDPFARVNRVVHTEISKYVILPHPSGLSRSWNVAGAYDRARAVLVAAGVLP